MKHFYSLITFLLFTSYLTTAQRASLPYFENFESGPAGWISSDDGVCGTSWELGTPTIGYTIGAYSGNKCWDVNLNTGYTNNAACYLISPIFDFTFVSNAQISFWTKYNAEFLWDYLSVQFTLNNGDTWTYLPFPNLISPDGYVLKWIKSALTVDYLYGNPNVQFRLAFVSDGSFTYDGYSIDDFRIELDALSSPELSAGDAFSIYPNPSRGEFNFSFAGKVADDAQLILYSTEGKNVMQFNASTLNQTSIADLNLPNGLYSVVFENNDSRVVKKLVVNR